MRCILLLFVSFFTINAAFASDEVCECKGVPTRTVPEALSYSTSVFTGRVTSITPITDTDYVAKFFVYDAWKGVNEPEIRIISTYSEKNCGFKFEIGGEYVVYSYKPAFLSSITDSKKQNKTPSVAETLVLSTVNSCDQTKELENISDDELRLLGVVLYSTKARTYTPITNSSDSSS